VWLKVTRWFLTSDVGKEIKELPELGRYSRVGRDKSVTVRSVLRAGPILQPQGV